MAIFYADSSGNYDDLYIYKNNVTGISDARNAIAGNANIAGLMYNWVVHGRHFDGGNYNMWISRIILSFDGSAISSAVSSANLKLTSLSNVEGYVLKAIWNDETYVCKAVSGGSVWSSTDFNSMDGWVDQESSWDGDVTQYATAFTNAASTTHTIALNATAISDLNSAIAGGNHFHLMLLHSDDFEYIVGGGLGSLGQPQTGGTIISLDGGRIYSSEHTTNAERPQLDITYSLGYSNDVAGVGSSNISTVSGIATANISKVNGV